MILAKHRVSLLAPCFFLLFGRAFPATPEVNFDIRDRLENRDLDLVEKRKSALPRGGPGARVVLNHLGLPKSLSRGNLPFSEPSNLSAEEIARGFLRANRPAFLLTDEDIRGLRLISRQNAAGLNVLRFEQTLRGVSVFEGDVRVAIDPDGRVVQAGAGDVIPRLEVNTNPRLTPREALERAFRILGIDGPETWDQLTIEADRASFRNPKGDGYSNITVELSLFPVTAASAVLAYRLYLEVDSGHWYEMLVDADDGKLLFRYNLYQNIGQARVWRESHEKGPRQLVTFPAAWLPAGSTVTTGNNVEAYLDIDGDNAPDTAAAPNVQAGHAQAANQLFDFAAGEGTTGQDPRSFKAASVTSLFYFTNLAHDYYYDLGFTEEAGNFQDDNLGHGGKGGDSLRAEAQDGSTTNNANFATPPDGTRPRLQGGIFSRSTESPTDDLDFSYDGQGIFHEYGHGLSNRLVGGLSGMSCLRGTQSAAMGEGWSDYFAASYFNNPVFGSYISQNRFRGIRRESYDGNRLTYEDLGYDDYEAHNDGEIWGATLWDIRTALGQKVTDQLVVDALKLTPCTPSMIDARDAILVADQNANGGANQDALWRIFARRGMGLAASGTDGGSTVGTVNTTSYDLTTPPLTVSSKPPGNPALGDSYAYKVDATDPDGTGLKYALVEAPAGMAIDSNGQIRWTAAFVGQPVKVAITNTQGVKVIHGFNLIVDTPFKIGDKLSIAAPERSVGRASLTVPANTSVLQITLRGGTGDSDLAVLDPDGLAYGRGSASDGPNETISILAPKAGRWSVLVSGFRVYQGVSLSADTPVPTVVPINTTVSGMSGAQTSETFFKVTVPANTALLKISMTGGTGDADLFVRKAQPPICSSVATACIFDGLSVNDGNVESVSITSPAAGDYYINVVGYRAYSGVDLSAVVTLRPATP